jgi:muramidase (phage lysozyme)
MGRSRAELEKYAENPYVRGYLDSLAWAEGTLESGYGTFFGGETIPIKPGMQHPDVVKKGRSAAFGRYQFMPFTWGPVQKALGLEDMTPRNQDIAALYLTDRRGVDLDRIAAGKIDEGDLDRLAPEWASLPTRAGKSYYGQPVKSAAEVLAIARREGKPMQQVGAGGVPRSDGAPAPAAGPTPGDEALTRMLASVQEQTAALVEATKPKPIEMPQMAPVPTFQPSVAPPASNPLSDAVSAFTGQPAPAPAPAQVQTQDVAPAAPSAIDQVGQARARRAQATQQFLDRDRGVGSSFGRLLQQRFAGDGLMDFLSGPLAA